MPLSFDIFCRVVDNYGDIGVCWRLARRLADIGQGPIRLWVDDLRSFSRIAPHVQPDAAEQVIDGVHVVQWRDASGEESHAVARAAVSGAVTLAEPADVIIEAFACTPPAAYIERLTPRQVWVNLEYLSAESWVASCHGLPSLQPNGLRKFFFFPGFTAETGGLLRETGLIDQRDAWQSEPARRRGLLERVGVEAAWLDRLDAGAALAYVYCYPEAPLESLIGALSRGDRDTLVLLPEGILPQGLPTPKAGRSQVELHTHAFVDQDTFDRLLWSSDLNIVRGEDSLVRALWAGRPLIWQPYLQADDAHLEKLEAWLEVSPFSPDVQEAMRAWNRGNAADATAALGPLLQRDRLVDWERQVREWCTRLTAQNELGEALVEFCAKNVQTR